jgi:8-oxo-dGTP diphosphatase
MNLEKEGAPAKPWGLSVCAVIRREDGRVLLLRRAAASTHFGGMWEVPGGKVEPGEDFDEALRREVDEECGLEIEIVGPAGVSSFELPAIRVLVLCMEARPTGGEVRISFEHEAYAWVSVSEISQYQIVEQIRPILATLR